MAGTADTLEALGVRIDVEPARQALILDEVGIVFLFAQLYHPATPASSGSGAGPTFATPASLSILSRSLSQR